MAIYLVQILNQPRQVIALEVRRAFPVLLPVKYVADLVVKFGRRFVEVTELLQGRETGCGHEEHR